MEMVIKFKDTVYTHTHNAIVIPRAGDTMEIATYWFVVKEVIWHIEPGMQWVEVQIRTKV